MRQWENITRTLHSAQEQGEWCPAWANIRLHNTYHLHTQLLVFPQKGRKLKQLPGTCYSSVGVCSYCSCSLFIN